MEVINSKQTKDQIADIIKHEIITGGLTNGMEIAQTYIADKLRVSRMPVREAFHRLVQEGYLERLPNRHMKVVGLNKKNIKRYINILSSVETEILMMIRKENIEIQRILNIKERFYELTVKETKKEIFMNQLLQFHFELSRILEDVYIMQIHHQLLEGLFHYCINHSTQNKKEINIQLDNIVSYLVEGKTDPRKSVETHIKEVLNEILEEKLDE